MKKLIAIALVGSLFSVPAMAQNSGLGLDVILGPQGVVQGLVTTLTTADAAPLINGLGNGNSGTVQGGVTGPNTLNSTLTALLVNQDPAAVAAGLQNTLTVAINAVSNGLIDGAGAGGIPGLGSLPALPGL